MKKTRINLLVNREDYQKYENFFERLKLSVAVFALFLFVVFIFFYLTIRKKFNTFEQMNLQKKTYLQLLTERRPDEAKINYIQKKYLDLKTFLKSISPSSICIPSPSTPIASAMCKCFKCFFNIRNLPTICRKRISDFFSRNTRLELLLNIVKQRARNC